MRFELNLTTGNVTKDKPDTIYNNSYSWIYKLAIDAENEYLYFINSSNNEFMRMTTNGSNTKTLFRGNFGYVPGLTVDWSSSNLYWTDTSVRSIEVAKADGRYRKTLLKFDADTRPTGIVADPVNG